jgi:hypothetical protein
MASLQIGYLLRAGITGFVAGCSVTQLEAPTLGSLVLALLDKEYSVYGLITDIHIEDDGLVRQLVTAGNISPEVMHDNRERRIVPIEISVLAVGYEQGGKISHLLPPRPPLSLDVIHLCSDAELAKFTSTGKFGYFRHILQASNIPIGEILAAHILDVKQKTNNNTWVEAATRELITLLRDDYPMLMSVLGALGELSGYR